ncbi:hypothetical protein [Lactococcus taiwanensis]|uniref:hypothetical protein n=1 Tax=Lactococcus taiwanensis TaxID=1151742 RepID=UPI003516D1D1
MGFDEEKFEQEIRQYSIELFLKKCENYEKQEVARLQKEGWKYTKVAYRQVLFFFFLLL